MPMQATKDLFSKNSSLSTLLRPHTLILSYYTSHKTIKTVKLSHTIVTTMAIKSIKLSDISDPHSFYKTISNYLSILHLPLSQTKCSSPTTPHLPRAIQKINTVCQYR